MDLPDLRPLSFGELLDRTFTYFRRHFWLFVGIMAIPEALIVSVGLVFDFFRRTFFGGTPFTMNPVIRPGVVPPPGVYESMIVGGVALILFSLFAGLAYFIFYSFALGATTFAVSEVHLGRPATARASLRSLRGKYLRLLGAISLIILIAFGAYLMAMLVLGIMIGITAVAGKSLGVAAVILLGLVTVVVAIAVLFFASWLLLRFSCTVPALLLENIGALPALGRSFKLTKGNVGRAFLIILLMYLVTVGVTLLVGSPFVVTNFYYAFKLHALPPLWVTLLSTLVGGVAGAATGPLMMIALALFYYDLRVRKEGFDLQAMMAALDAQAPLAGSPAVPGAMPLASPGQISEP